MKERLRTLMQLYGINQSELAVKIGVSKMTISHIMSEGGRGGSFKPETIEAIQRAFPSVDINWLVYGTGNAPQSDEEATLFNQPQQLHVAPESTLFSQENEEQTEEQPIAQEPNEEMPQVTRTKRVVHINKKEEDKAPENRANKQIEKIIILYTDGTFKDYRPE